MPIRFSCPNGHVLSCPDKAAGRKSRCPECNVEVVVPSPSAPAQVEETIVFLCPNGHRLNGPRRLEGKAGQCPHCGARFRIPSREDELEASQDAPADGTGGAWTNGDANMVVEPPLVDASAEISSGSGSGFDKTGSGPKLDRVGGSSATRSGEFSFDFLGGAAEAGSSIQALAQVAEQSAEISGMGKVLPALFERLWQERQSGAVIEVHLSDGSLIVPDRYASIVSKGTHGLFATRDPDGSYNLTVVAWSGVARILARRVTTLPEELFS